MLKTKKATLKSVARENKYIVIRFVEIACAVCKLHELLPDGEQQMVFRILYDFSIPS